MLKWSFRIRPVAAAAGPARTTSWRRRTSGRSATTVRQRRWHSRKTDRWITRSPAAGSSPPTRRRQTPATLRCRKVRHIFQILCTVSCNCDRTVWKKNKTFSFDSLRKLFCLSCGPLLDSNKYFRLLFNLPIFRRDYSTLGRSPEGLPKKRLGTAKAIFLQAGCLFVTRCQNIEWMEWWMNE